MNWFFTVIRKYAVFRGRARRREYWWYTLIYLVIYFALMWVDMQLVAEPDSTFQEKMTAMEGRIGVTAIFQWGLFLPSIAVAVRRLHDTDRSGWWVLLPVGPMILAFFAGIAMAISGMDASDESNLSILLVVTGILGLLMLCGGLVLLVFMCFDGTPGPNRFGDDPKGRGEAKSDDVWPELA